MRVVVSIVVAGVLAIPTVAGSQSRRIVGRQISAHVNTDGATGHVVDTATMTFADSDGGAEFTVDFIARYASVQPTRPAVVDVVITQLAAGDDHPEMRLQVDGEPITATARMNTHRSIVTSLPFDEFLKIANASTFVESAFGTELEFGAVQLRMLRTIAQRWTRR